MGGGGGGGGMEGLPMLFNILYISNDNSVEVSNSNSSLLECSPAVQEVVGSNPGQDISVWDGDDLSRIINEQKVVLHNGGFYNACTMKRYLHSTNTIYFKIKTNSLQVYTVHRTLLVKVSLAALSAA